MKKYLIPDIEILHFTAEDSIMDIISASANKEGSVGEYVSLESFIGF